MPFTFNFQPLNSRNPLKPFYKPPPCILNNYKLLSYNSLFLKSLTKKKHMTAKFYWLSYWRLWGANHIMLQLKFKANVEKWVLRCWQKVLHEIFISVDGRPVDVWMHEKVDMPTIQAVTNITALYMAQLRKAWLFKNSRVFTDTPCTMVTIFHNIWTIIDNSQLNFRHKQIPASLMTVT